MATGRTHNRWLRVYVDGYDLSGYVRDLGECGAQFPEVELSAVSDAVKGYLPGQPAILGGPLNGLFDNTASAGLHAVASGAGVARTILAPIGIRASPAAGDPCFIATLQQLSYQATESGGGTFATVGLGAASPAALPGAGNPWGVLVHAKGAETGVNASTGLDDRGASSTLGGLFAYQVFTSNGTATIKLQHAAANNDGSFADLTGATSGSVNASVTPVAGQVVIAPTTVNRYLRWQIVLGTATTVTFALGFVRN